MAEKITVIPDMTGWGSIKKGKFYKEHKDEILADYELLGKKKTLQKWQVSLSGWAGLRRRWGFQEPKKEGRKSSRMPYDKWLEGQLAKEGSELGREELLKELDWLRGYHQAVLDILGNKYSH